MIESFRNKKILVVVAHPDDELLGLGGTINKLINQYNCEVRAVILGEGITSRSVSRNTNLWKEQLKMHKNNIEEARKKIGYNSVGIYDFPDNRFDSVDLLDLIKVVEKEKELFSPEIIFTHHGGDLNIDHRRTFEAVITATRPLENEKIKTIITFETPSGTEWIPSTDPKKFVPNFYVKIDNNNLEAKIEAMECYEFEKRKYPHPRSPKSLRLIAQSRGIIIGVDYAECFCIVRTF